jgi:hypothetical protein
MVQEVKSGRLLFNKVACPSFVSGIYDAIDRIETAIRRNWERVCEEAELSPVDKNYLWGAFENS